MALFSMFKKVPNQRYRYIPRYWDPEKEKRQDRIRIMKGKESGDISSMKDRVASGLQRGRSSGRSKQVFKTNMRLVAVIVALIALSYFFLTVYLPEIVSAVEGTN